jgi:hypothetical protein
MLRAWLGILRVLAGAPHAMPVMRGRHYYYGCFLLCARVHIVLLLILTLSLDMVTVTAHFIGVKLNSVTHLRWHSIPRYRDPSVFTTMAGGASVMRV